MTMIDQATELRQLARRDPSHASSFASPRLIAVTSGKGGVGTSTLALNLAVALSMSSRRVALVDVDLNGAAGVARWGDADVPAVIERGPAGLQLLTGDWCMTGRPETSIAAKLQAAVCDLDGSADVVVLDIRSGVQRMLREFWAAVDSWVLVSSPDPLAL